MNHERARALFAKGTPPLRCCEAVIAEACFLMRKIHPSVPAEVIALARRGVYNIAMSAGEHWPGIEAILTFDGDFGVYKWARSPKFEILLTRDRLHLAFLGCGSSPTCNESEGG